MAIKLSDRPLGLHCLPPANNIASAKWGRGRGDTTTTPRERERVRLTLAHLINAAVVVRPGLAPPFYRSYYLEMMMSRVNYSTHFPPPR